MGLFDWFKKKETKEKNIAEVRTNSSGERLDHLTSDGDLPWGWVYAYKDFTEQIEKEYEYFRGLRYQSRNKSPKEQYAALKSLVLYMEDVKSLCASKGECFDFWRKEILFSDKELKEFIDKLEHIKEHYDDLLDEYQREEYIKNCILPELPKIIKANPGILQTEIYKMFPIDCKNHISNELYSLDRNGKILRERSSRSYKLKMK